MKHIRSPRLAGFRGAAFALGVLVPMVACAEVSSDSLLGLGLRSRPAYDGAATQRTELVPVVRVLGQPWFVRSTQGLLEGGLRVQLAAGLHAGAQLAYEAGRYASESTFLASHAVANVKRGVSVGAQLEWDHTFGPMPVTLLARVRQHTDADLGAQADLRLSAGVFQGGSFSAGVFAQATWANAKSAGAYYSITAQQSASTRLSAYTAGGGGLYAGYGLLWSYELSRSWVAVGSLEARRLQGDAAHSPLAQRTSNQYASAGIAYRY